jgi:hypothetical protein
MNLRVLYDAGNFLISWKPVSFSRNILLHDGSKSKRHDWAALCIPHDENRFSCRYVVFEKPQTTDNDQIIFTVTVILTSTIGFTFQCRPSNTIRSINIEQRTSWYYTSELQPTTQKIQRNSHVNAPRVRNKKHNYMDCHTKMGNQANFNCHRHLKNWPLITKPQIRP